VNAESGCIERIREGFEDVRIVVNDQDRTPFFPRLLWGMWEGEAFPGSPPALASSLVRSGELERRHGGAQ